MKIETRNSDLGEGGWDAIVVGAGVAGGVAAGAAGTTRVEGEALLEKSAWPRDKACGGCLNAAGVGMLRACGLGEVLCGPLGS